MLASTVLHASGYRSKGNDRHSTTFKALEIALGDKIADVVEELQAIRMQRHGATYDGVDAVSKADLDALIALIETELRPAVGAWFARCHPDLA